VDAIQKLFPYIEFFFKIGFLYKDDLSYYFDKRPFVELGVLKYEEFSNMVEPILLLEYNNMIYLVH
jgi:hypothetical protein